MHGFPTAENPDPLFLYLIFLFITFFLSYHITRHISNFSLFLPISLSFPLWTVYTPKECQRNVRIFILLPFEDTDSPKLPLKKTSWSCSILWFLRRQINSIHFGKICMPTCTTPHLIHSPILLIKGACIMLPLCTYQLLQLEP